MSIRRNTCYDELHTVSSDIDDQRCRRSSLVCLCLGCGRGVAQGSVRGNSNLKRTLEGRHHDRAPTQLTAAHCM